MVEGAPPEDGRMKNLAEQFLSKKQQQQITEAVQEAERLTSGEIVPMVVSQSDDYTLATLTCGFSLALPLSLLFTHLLGRQLWIGPQNMYLFLCLLGFLSFTLFHLTKHNTGLKRFFLGSALAEKEVNKAALAAFYQEQLYKTEKENGILLYISVMEQRVCILADRGINDIVEPSTWNTYVVDITGGIRDGNRCDSICTAIEKIGTILADHFPYQKDDKDELHNLILK